MSTKKTTQTQESKTSLMADNWNSLFKWLFVVGGIVAGVTNAIAFQPDYLIWGLMLIGIVVGIFYFDSDDLINIGLRYLIFGGVANAIGGFYQIGPYLGSFFLGFFYYLGPIVLTLCVIYFVKKYFLNKQ
jgi:hypothetical protein